MSRRQVPHAGIGRGGNGYGSVMTGTGQAVARAATTSLLRGDGQASSRASVSLPQNSEVSLLSQDQSEQMELERHGEDVLTGMHAMWRQQLLCDVTINVESSRLRAHKLVLASCSYFFYRLFLEEVKGDVSISRSQDGHIEVTLHGISAATMTGLLECMYSGRIHVHQSNVMDLLAASARLRYQAVEEACSDFLVDRLSVTNCLRIFHIASDYGLSGLLPVVLAFSANNFMEVTQGPDYTDLDIDQLRMLLARDDISAPGELDIFKRALGWVEHQKKDRIQYVRDVMNELRLPLLSPGDIVDHVENVDYLMDVPECQRMVKEALHYHCLPARQSLLQVGLITLLVLLAA